MDKNMAMDITEKYNIEKVKKAWALYFLWKLFKKIKNVLYKDTMHVRHRKIMIFKVLGSLIYCIIYEYVFQTIYEYRKKNNPLTFISNFELTHKGY